MPSVKIPPPYRGPTRGRGCIEVTGATVLECIEAVEALHPGFAAQVLDARGNTHGFVKLFVNGDEIDRSALGTPLRDADEVEILAAIAGG
jgi:molybdopterin converting factor small subunit